MMNDLISRQAAIDALAKAMPSLTTPDGCGQFDHDIYIAQETFVDSMQIIADLPSAERLGRWIESDIKNEKYVCSVCGGACWYYDYEGDVAKSNYCPNCGARMEVE